MRNRKTLRRTAGHLTFDDLEMSSWWDSETSEFQTFVLRLLSSMPGGDLAEDVGFAPFGDFLGWQEVKMITELLDKIEYKDDVNQIIEDILGGEEEEEDEY